MTTRVAPDAAARFRIVAYAISAISAVACVFAVIAVLHTGDRVRLFGWSSESQADGSFMLVVTPDGPAAGILRTGDVVVALNGDRRVARWSPFNARLFVFGEDAYTITVRRDGQERTFELKPIVTHSVEQDRITRSIVFNGAVWCLVATLIALFRSDLPIARAAYAAGMAMGLFFLRQSFGPALPWMSPALQLARHAIFPIAPLHMAIGFDFYVRFPRNAPPPRFLRWLRVGLYAACGVVALFSGLGELVLRALGQDRYSAGRAVLAPLDNPLYLTMLFAEVMTGLGIFATLTYNYRRVDREDDRRRIRWIVWGTVLGLLPFTVFTGSQALGQFAPALRLPGGLWVFGNLATVAIPLSFGYAIIKHQIFDITFVIRRGLQYLLAKQALRALIFLPLAALAYGVVIHRDQPIGQLLVENSIYFYFIVAAAVGLWFRTPLMRWVDRRFFREAYARERILVELVEHVGQMDSASNVAKLVSHEIEAAFHPKCLFVWYREAARPHLTLSYSSGGYIHTADLEPGAPLARLAEGAAGPIDVKANDALDSLPDTDRAWLTESGVRLIVPMTGGDRQLVGLLMLGDRKSEEPYSSDDLTLLQAIARQIGLAHDNARLKGRADDDRRVRHDVIAKLDPSRVNVLKECPTCGTCYDAAATVCAVDRAELTLTLPIERTIDGKYRLERLLGKGGMGAVYEASDLRLARTVAVKILLGGSFGDRMALRRFEREAQASARLTHPNVVTVYDFGAVGADGAFIVMELLPGRTLRAELRRLGARPAAAAAAWFEQIGAGVSAAHAQGIVHRDLKPENVIISTGSKGDDRVKVLDFGLAKMRTLDHSPSGGLTQSGAVMGTAGYMAPEQLTGGEIDERTDVFALGVMVAETVTGRRPFDGRTMSEHLLAILQEPLQLPAEGLEWRHLERTLQRSVAKNPRDRYRTVEDFMGHLLPALAAFPSPVVNADEPTRL